MITLLLSLMNDPHELDAFRRNPSAIIQRSSLSVEDAAAIKSGDMDAISTRLAAAGKHNHVAYAKISVNLKSKNVPHKDLKGKPHR